VQFPAVRLPLETVEVIARNLIYCTHTPRILTDLLLRVHCTCPSPSSRHCYCSLGVGLTIEARVGKTTLRTRGNSRILRRFSRLPNVQGLQVNNLDIPSFMPRIRRYFGHVLRWVRLPRTDITPMVPSADQIFHWTVSTPTRPHPPRLSARSWERELADGPRSNPLLGGFQRLWP
jgi:hypothetical protein